jgi:hypothetical protein
MVSLTVPTLAQYPPRDAYGLGGGLGDAAVVKTDFGVITTDPIIWFA